MPAVTQPINIHVGAADIWIGVDVPAVPPVPLVGGYPQTGRFVGATLAPANFIYRPTTFDIMTQQDTAVQGYVITQEDLRIEFEIGELTYETLRDIWIGSFDQGSYVSLGGIVFPKTFSVLLLVPKRLGSGTGVQPTQSSFIQAMVYQAVFAEDRSLPFQREGHSNVRVVARAQGVSTRQRGDRLGYIHPHVISG
jgi:hypothetical protein